MLTRLDAQRNIVEGLAFLVGVGEGDVFHAERRPQHAEIHAGFFRLVFRGQGHEQVQGLEGHMGVLEPREQGGHLQQGGHAAAHRMLTPMSAPMVICPSAMR